MPALEKQENIKYAITPLPHCSEEKKFRQKHRCLAAQFREELGQKFISRKDKRGDTIDLRKRRRILNVYRYFNGG